MTFSSVAQANSKTAEFARLFDLFDRVATRRTRAPTSTGDTRELITADDIANVPAEFAPLLKNLSTVLASRAQAAPATRVRLASVPIKTLTTKCPAPSSGLVEIMEPSDRIVEDGPESPTFPLGERYPFTFKLMLHKLYDLDEWAEKVKHALETSKSQFKPLAERVQNVVRDATANIKERGEKKSGVRSALGVSAKFRSPGATRRRSSAVHPESEPSRVLKKRCIGRRKSVSGPMSTSVWVYDAAISATEAMGPHPAVEITFSKPRNAGGAVETRTRHQSLTALEERRKVKIAMPLFQGVLGSTLPQMQSVSFAKPARETIETKNVKRLVEPCMRVAMKRHFGT